MRRDEIDIPSRRGIIQFPFCDFSDIFTFHLCMCLSAVCASETDSYLDPVPLYPSKVTCSL